MTPYLMGNSSSYLTCFTEGQCIPDTLMSVLWAYLICARSWSLTTTTMEGFGLLAFFFFKASSHHSSTTQFNIWSSSPRERSRADIFLLSLGPAQVHSTHLFRERLLPRLVSECGKGEGTCPVFLVELCHHCAGRNNRFGRSGGESARGSLVVY